MYQRKCCWWGVRIVERWVHRPVHCFGFQFAKGGQKLPDHAVEYYVDAIASDPNALRGSFGQYRADDLQTLVIPGCGHWVAEEAPEELLAALTAFLAPYRDGPGPAAAHNPRPHAAGD
jgi:pimeloyl-ACP methyl ester carboxylesterase